MKLSFLYLEMIQILMKTLKDHINEEQGPCWDGYKQVGMKKKGNKMVPNCVPVGEAGFFTDEDRDKYVSDEIKKRKLARFPVNATDDYKMKKTYIIIKWNF